MLGPGGGVSRYPSPPPSPRNPGSRPCYAVLKFSTLSVDSFSAVQARTSISACVSSLKRLEMITCMHVCAVYETNQLRMVETVMPRSAIIDPVTFTINRTGSSRSRSRTNTDRILAIRSRWRFDGGRLNSRRSRSIPGRN